MAQNQSRDNVNTEQREIIRINEDRTGLNIGNGGDGSEEIEE